MIVGDAAGPNAICALRGVVLDWAGTTVDFGSLAPVRTLQRVFDDAGMPISEDEARRDMGIPKRSQIAAMLNYPSVSERWKKAHHAAPGDADIERLYRLFMPLQLSCMEEYSDVIPGAADAIEEARGRGLKIGSTTGYTRPMLDAIVEKAAQQGYRPDASVTPDEVESGRPLPFMIYENARRLSIYPPAAIVKVGDTPSDVQEGLNAGAWSVGVACTGNMVGLSRLEFDRLPESEKAARRQKAIDSLMAAGAHFVIDSLAELGQVLDHIGFRLASR